MERLQRYLARAGVASRRACEALILSGAVCVNGRQAELGAKVDAFSDRVTVRGRRIEPPREPTYIILNKPAGYVTTMRDPQGRPRVVDLLPPGLPRVYPVGRLDLDTTGLLLLCNDGDLAQKLLHPSRGVWKTYRARVRGRPSREDLDCLRRGIVLEDGPAAPARVKILEVEDGYATVEIELHEGRKRQVRRMLAAVGHEVVSLARVGIGPLRLNDLAPGSWRYLEPDEVAVLREAAAREPRGGGG